MANIKVPAVRTGHDIIEQDDEYPLSTIYPTDYVLPKPSRWAFVNERMARRVKSYTEVVDETNKLFDSLATHQRARARLDNIHMEVKYDREVLAYNIDRVQKKRRELHYQPAPQLPAGEKQQRPSLSLATMFGEVDDE